MYFGIVTALMLLLSSTILLWTDILEGNLQDLERRLRYLAAMETGHELHRYYDQHRAIPTGAGVSLMSQPGFEHLRTWDLPHLEEGYTVGIAGQNWEFARAVLAYPDPWRVPELQGNSAFSSGVSPCAVDITNATWCPPENGFHSVLETRAHALTDIAIAQKALQRTGYKIAMVFRATGDFPVLHSGNPDLSVGDGHALTDLIGYSGSAAACDGPFTWAGVVLDCSDLYNLWGEEVVYTYLGTKEIGLSARSGLKTAAGADYYISSIVSFP